MSFFEPEPDINTENDDTCSATPGYRFFFSLLGSNYIDSSLIFKDGIFEDVSKYRKAICWEYFLLDKENQRAKCQFQISEGEYCDKVYSAQGRAFHKGSGEMKNHLKKHLS